LTSGEKGLRISVLEFADHQDQEVREGNEGTKGHKPPGPGDCMTMAPTKRKGKNQRHRVPMILSTWDSKSGLTWIVTVRASMARRGRKRAKRPKPVARIPPILFACFYPFNGDKINFSLLSHVRDDRNHPVPRGASSETRAREAPTPALWLATSVSSLVVSSCSSSSRASCWPSTTRASRARTDHYRHASRPSLRRAATQESGPSESARSLCCIASHDFARSASHSWRKHCALEINTKR